MTAITPIPALMGALDGSITNHKPAGETGALGYAVSLQSDGALDKCTAVDADFVGIAIAASRRGTTYAAGEMVTYVVFGPVTGFSGLTPGTDVFLAANGGLADSGVKKIGYVDTSESIFIMRAFTAPVS